jgi:hypothetical protein
MVGRLRVVVITFVALLVAVGCGGKNTPSQVDLPGGPKSGKSKALEAGAAALQDKTPVDHFHVYVCGFHFYSGDLSRQVEAHHYCIQSNEDVHQCVIFDGNGHDAKLIGIEYIITDRLFRSLPEDEKRLWHSHVYEVSSGELVAPGLPQKAEHELMEKLITTYGKTFHTWQVDRGDKLPLGIPQLMMGFTQDGQLKDELAKDRDARMKTSVEQERRDRANIPRPTPARGADAWQGGRAVQLDVSEVPMAPAAESGGAAVPAAAAGDATTRPAPRSTAP